MWGRGIWSASIDSLWTGTEDGQAMKLRKPRLGSQMYAFCSHPRHANPENGGLWTLLDREIESIRLS